VDHDFAAVLYYSSFNDSKLEVINYIQQGQFTALEDYQNLVDANTDRYYDHNQESAAWFDLRITSSPIDLTDYYEAKNYLQKALVSRPPLPDVNMGFIPSRSIEMIFGQDAMGIRVKALTYLIFYQLEELDAATEVVKSMYSLLSATDCIISSHQTPSWQTFISGFTFNQALAETEKLYPRVADIRSIFNYKVPSVGPLTLGYWRSSSTDNGFRKS
jgi:hypothetical protein